jgi:hypothetical protein
MVGYRSGHNGIASKAIVGSRPPWVQIPPPPLVVRGASWTVVAGSPLGSGLAPERLLAAEPLLPPTHVVPAAELEAHLPKHTDLFEAE